MRSVALAIAIAACAASAAQADRVPDRYSGGGKDHGLALTRTSTQTGPATPSPYSGRLLSWGGKSGAASPTQATPLIATQPAQHKPSFVPVQTPKSTAPTPVALRPLASSTQAGLLGGPPPRAKPLNPTQPSAPLGPKAASATVSAAATPTPAGARPRLYSLHREYGLTPDADTASAPLALMAATAPLDQPEVPLTDRRRDLTAANRPVSSRRAPSISTATPADLAGGVDQPSF